MSNYSLGPYYSALPDSHRQLLDQHIQSLLFRRDSTIKNRILCLAKFAYVFKDRALTELTRKDIRDYFYCWHQSFQHLKPSYLKFHLMQLSAFYKWMIQEDLYSSDIPPTYGIRFPRYYSESHVFTPEEFDAMDRIADAPAMHVMYRALYYTIKSCSLRINEMLQVKKSMVDLKQCLLYVPKDITKREVPKTVPISKKARDLIAEWLIIDSSNCEYIFHNTLDTRLSYMQAIGLMRRIMNAAFPNRRYPGIFGFHQFRHTFASEWIDCKGDPIVLMRIMGWRSLRMANRYAHVSPQLVKEWSTEIERRKLAGYREINADTPHSIFRTATP